MARGEAFDQCAAALEEQVFTPVLPAQELMEAQCRRTADAFAVDMLLAKFVQSLPFIGMAGGAANPYYYRKILSFVRLQYRKRYLLEKEAAGRSIAAAGKDMDAE